MINEIKRYGYRKPYVSFGIDLLNTSAQDTWFVSNFNGIYQFVKDDYLIQFNGDNVIAAYNDKKDWMLQNDLHSKLVYQPVLEAMERQLKAIIQSYMQRMMNNQLIYIISDNR